MEYKLNSVEVKSISSFAVPQIVGVVEHKVRFHLTLDEIDVEIDWPIEANESQSLDIVCSDACNQLAKAFSDLSSQLSEMATKSFGDHYTE